MKLEKEIEEEGAGEGELEGVEAAIANPSRTWTWLQHHITAPTKNTAAALNTSAENDEGEEEGWKEDNRKDGWKEDLKEEGKEECM